MKLRLSKFLNTLSQWFKNDLSHFQVSEKFEDDEKIVRSIYSPKNFHKTKGTLLPNAFRTPSDIDEVSVNRLNYTDANFCKKLSKENQTIGERDYFGLAILLKNEIDKSNCSIVYSPILDPIEKVNLFHSDIKIGYIPKKGEELPSEISKKIKDLTELARFYKDPNPNSKEWNGEELN